MKKEEFIKKAKKTHVDKYNYTLVNYINNKTKIKIIRIKKLNDVNNILESCFR